VHTLQHAQFTEINTPTVPILQFTQQEINQGNIQFILDSSGLAPSYSVSVQDSCGLSSGIQSASIAYNLSPVIGHNQLTIGEGARLILNNSLLSATDPENMDNNLQFTVSYVQHCKFSTTLLPNLAINQFSQQNISNGKIQLIHDGSCSAPSYSIIVNDSRGACSEVSTAEIMFIPIYPVIKVNTFSVQIGQIQLVNNAIFSAIDPGDVPAHLIFTVSNLQHASFVPAQFTQDDINNERIQFIQDGSLIAPSFQISVQDSCGLVSSTQTLSSDNRIEFIPTEAINENLNSSDDSLRNGIIAGVTCGAVCLFFYGLKRYLSKKSEEYMNQETNAYRTKIIIPIAKEIYNHLKISGCMGYMSQATHRDFLNSIDVLVRHLENTGIAVQERLAQEGLDHIQLLHEITRQTRLALLGQEAYCSTRICTHLLCAEITPSQIEEKAAKIASAVKQRLDNLSPLPARIEVTNPINPMVFSSHAKMIQVRGNDDSHAASLPLTSVATTTEKANVRVSPLPLGI
jgi:hypothetical protein